MKLVIKTLNGRNEEIAINGMPNLRELRERVASALNTSWDRITIIIVDKSGTRLTFVYMDDPSDLNLDDFIKSQKTIEQLNLDELTLYVTYNLGPYYYRPNKLNPHGMAAHEGHQMEQLYPTSKDITLFFQNAVTNNENTKNFDEHIDGIPEKFLDPITNELMNNPVISSDQRTYDLTTLTKLNFISPFTKEKVRIVEVRPRSWSKGIKSLN